MSFHSRKLLFGSDFTDPYWNNVSLLLHGDGIGSTPNGQQNNTFLDSSANNYAITRNGTPTQGSFSPYALNGVAYSPTLHGGGAYFNGSTDYLTAPSSNNLAFGTGDFTVECWYYPLDNTRPYPSVLELGIQGNSQSAGFLFSGLTPFMYSGVFYNPASNSVSLNQWNHVVWQRTSGIFKMFVNGIGSSTVSFTNNLTLPSQVSIAYPAGSNPGGTANSLNGYISNLRITKGAALYTSNFTPPTSPVTLTSNGGATPSTAPTSGQVALLCDFTNAGIFDNTKKNVLTTVGNARVSTSIVKFGTGSMYFDGTGDYLTLPSNNNFAFGTGDFTVEFWMYPTANTPWITLCGTQPAAITDPAGWNITITNGSPEIAFWSNAQFVPATIILNQWNYVSVTRSGTTLRMFINGTIANSTTNSQNFTYNQLGVGCTGVGIQPYNGYIDDLRITKGVARYTANFTPPARAFPNK
jgi:hypothetical protein